MNRGWAILLSGCLFSLSPHPLPAMLSSDPSPTPPPAARRLVLCLDGTWNSTYDEDERRKGDTVLKPSNVLKLCRAVVPHGATAEQIAFYQIGVGSLALYPGLSNGLLHVTDKFLGGAFGAGFEANIEEALGFLVGNYQPGDQVFVFGFSRGAATARGLTRFLDWTGGLPVKRDAYYMPQLFRQFARWKGKRSFADVLKEINDQRAKEEKPLPPLEPLQAVNVEFLGVWDTVMALGSRFEATEASTSPSHSFYVGTQPARCVKNARQALAVDEARFDFRPEIWQSALPGQTLVQRWFVGVHSNVGGGYDRDGLANLTFRWMLKEAEPFGLEVDPEYTKHFVGFPTAQIYSSYSIFYRFLDWVRFRSGRGKRSLLAPPATANLSLDRSVIQRIETKKSKDFAEYRPPNVLQFLACQPDLESYLKGLGLQGKELQLPDNVLARLGKLKANCGKT